jgi:hypothetical protein
MTRAGTLEVRLDRAREGQPTIRERAQRVGVGIEGREAHTLAALRPHLTANAVLASEQRSSSPSVDHVVEDAQTDRVAHPLDALHLARDAGARTGKSG